MFLNLFLIIVIGVLGGLVFEKIKLPKLIWYLILGILLGPSVLNIVNDDLNSISSYLRQIALIIILTRSGLSLDFKALKEVGLPAILMCFVPACFEIIGIVIFAPLLLNINVLEALLLGSVLAAVSPAVVVPRMIKLKEEGYGNKSHIPELVMAGASCDDIFVIVLFYSFKTLVSSNHFNVTSMLNIPVSILLGIVLGLLVSIIFIIISKKVNIIFKVILLLGLSFGMLYLEESLKEYIKISSLLGIIVMGIVITKYNSDLSKQLNEHYNNLWNYFEILLFSLVGMLTDAKLAFSKDGILILCLIIIALIFRSIGVIVCIIVKHYSIKEILFIIFSYLPKATVQASIGGIALSEGLSCGKIVLTAAVIAILFTAPLGAILMDVSYKKLLK